MSIAELRDLRVELPGGAAIVDDVSISLVAGEIVGLVGESGSGKTTVATALLGYARRGARITGGTVVVDGTDLLTLSPGRLASVRGRVVSYVPQDPATALNPALRIGTQLTEVVAVHEPARDRAAALRRVREALTDVRLPATEDWLRRFPHQLSGGQQQRVCIAMAFIMRPRLVVLDEPTTGLDVTTQAHVVETVRELCERHRVAALYVTHDLAVVAGLADRVLVMYAGRIVEAAPTAELFARPGHPYTDKLISAIPDVTARRDLISIPGRAPHPGERAAGCAFAPRCDRAVPECLHATPVLKERAGRALRCVRPVVRRREVGKGRMTVPKAGAGAALLRVVDLSARHPRGQVLGDVNFEMHPRECLAIVGESGSGKTTLARCLVGLHADWRGSVVYGQEPLARRARERTPALRREIQYVFQSPYNSLNPRRSIGDTLALPIALFDGLSRRAARKHVAEALDRVALPPSTADRFPDQLSGGERQRVAIGRALVCKPRLLICDEVTSALDVSVQASIVRLLRRLQEEEGLTMLFVTHDLALVRAVADRLLVLRHGQVVEQGDADDVLDAPTERYTRQLLADTPAAARASMPDELESFHGPLPDPRGAR